MKTQVMMTLDIDLVKKARDHKINMSKAATLGISRELGETLEKDDPEAKEKRIKEEIEHKKSELNQIKKEIDEREDQLKALETEKTSYFERKKEEAKQLKEKYDNLIATERKNWHMFKNRGDLSTLNKRDRLYKQRSKIIGLPIDTYMFEIVDVCERGL